MTESNQPICPVCREPVPEGAGLGLCPRCVFAQAASTQLSATRPMGLTEPPSIETVQAAFPQLEICSLIGNGGMGVVYKARQPRLNRFVALKLLAPDRAGDELFAQRFATEAQALASLSHPNIVAIHDFGEAGGFYYLLMEFVDGLNLRQLLKSRHLTPTEALSIVPPICEALQCAHQRGIVHRDIKPENLLLDKSGTIKIADFGIAKMLDASSLGYVGSSAASASDMTAMAGTPDYAAPEQRKNGPIDHRADIYSLGVVLYEMLTGERPKDHFQPPSRRVQVDVRIDEIVLKALETKPELRFATVEELRTQVEAVQKQSSRPTWDFDLMIRRSKVLLVFFALLAVPLVVFSLMKPKALLPPLIAAPELKPPLVAEPQREIRQTNLPATASLESPLLQTVREFEEVTAALFAIEKEAFLEKADPSPLTDELRQRQAKREARQTELKAREGELRQAIKSLVASLPEASSESTSSDESVVDEAAHEPDFPPSSQQPEPTIPR